MLFVLYKTSERAAATISTIPYTLTTIRINLYLSSARKLIAVRPMPQARHERATPTGIPFSHVAVFMENDSTTKETATRAIIAIVIIFFCLSFIACTSISYNNVITITASPAPTSKYIPKSLRALLRFEFSSRKELKIIRIIPISKTPIMLTA